MLKLAFALAAFTVAIPAAAQDAPAASAPMSVAAMKNDPRMIAALRHANLVADHKCGETVGGITDLATKAEAQKCRRRMVETAKLDAQGEIEGR